MLIKNAYRWRASKMLDLGISYKNVLSSIGKNIGSAFGMPENYGSIVVGKKVSIFFVSSDINSSYEKM